MVTLQSCLLLAHLQHPSLYQKPPHLLYIPGQLFHHISPYEGYAPPSRSLHPLRRLPIPRLRGLRPTALPLPRLCTLSPRRATSAGPFPGSEPPARTSAPGHGRVQKARKPTKSKTRRGELEEKETKEEKMKEEDVKQEDLKKDD